jgi:alkanesulfonate monooxygenase SsuD/methylene tetrahydromethanopterin reductase-like flavin-dependent oxidoreductase (luciferase family)
VDYGVVMFPTEYAIAPDELARALEERGFESVWFPEHTHIPASRRSPWPGGAPLPREYWSAYDPFVAHGSGDCDQARSDGHLPRRRARSIVTAKAVATVDRLSGAASFRHRRQLER